MAFPEAQFSYLKLPSKVLILMTRAFVSSCKQIMNGIDCACFNGLAVSPTPAQTSTNTHVSNTNLALFMSASPYDQFSTDREKLLSIIRGRSQWKGLLLSTCRSEKGTQQTSRDYKQPRRFCNS
jgi:hypothetical protein